MPIMIPGAKYDLEELEVMGMELIWASWQDKETDLYPRWMKNPEQPDIIYVFDGSDEVPSYQPTATECVTIN